MHNLPSDAVSAILNQCSDFQSIFALGQSSPQLQEAIYNQQWACTKCTDLIFKTPNELKGASSSTKSRRRRHDNNITKQPFICQVCHDKFCGERVDYDKRFCRPQKCSGCGKVECYQCMTNHMGNDDGYGSENYCADCQAEFEFSMGGC